MAILEFLCCIEITALIIECPQTKKATSDKTLLLFFQIMFVEPFPLPEECVYLTKANKSGVYCSIGILLQSLCITLVRSLERVFLLNKEFEKKKFFVE